jgi:hypothetical protein
MSRLLLLIAAGIAAYALVAWWAFRVTGEPADPFVEPFGDC